MKIKTNAPFEERTPNRAEILRQFENIYLSETLPKPLLMKQACSKRIGQKFLKRRRKRPFILLEVLIALALVSLFALPLVRAPLETVHEETKTLCKLEVERQADLAFAEVKELFYTQSIPWDSFAKNKSLTYPLGKLKIGSRTFEKTAIIHVSLEKEIEGGKIVRRLGVSLHFDSHGLKEEFKYTMVVMR